MKTSRTILGAGLFAGTASFLSAGPGPQFWNRPATPKTAPAAVAPATATPEAPVCASCACCRKA